MDIFDLESDFLEYDEDIYPVEIGLWQSYEPYHDASQLQLQLEHLITLPISNAYGPVKFILSIKKLLNSSIINLR